MPTNARVPEPSSKAVAERYRIEAELGRGGMAVVYHAHDPVRGRSVALKRLLTNHASDTRVARLFELEYYTLSQLEHPRIIEVYDYQSDDDGPFYTMELLTGGDLRRRAPIPWREACSLLCDICSALALMHSRRLVHRDLTPLNVRCTSDGRAKLFDFGSMTQFGRAKHVVGTPPFVAPEALNGQIVDGQTDLYSLGATAYYALTGRHAYPARALADLPDFWASPPPAPSKFVPGVPPALDELIMALLEQSRDARPASAAEVMERLSAVGGFELQEALLVTHSYLSTPTLVGRDDQVASFGRRLERLEVGRGAAMHVHGASGSGRSRLLDACALQAKLSGRLVLRIDALTAGLERWGGISMLLDQLKQQLPELSFRLFAPYEALLALIPATSQGAGHGPGPNESAQSVAPKPGQPGRAELQAALREILWALAQQRPPVLVVDDLDRLDEPSAAFFALLAHGVTDHPALILSSAETDSTQRAVQLVASVADGYRLRNLDRSETDALIVSLFGDVGNVHWLAERIFDVSRGNPANIMRIAQYLVQRGDCKYAAGTWTLPVSLDVDRLTPALQERIDPSLPESALELAQVLALSGLARVSVDQCLQLSGGGDLKRLQADLQALAAAEIVTVDEAEVRLSRPGWKSVLLAELEPSRQREFHLRVAHFLAPLPAATFRRIEHLLHAGQTAQSLDVWLQDLELQRDVRLRDPETSFEHLQGLPKSWAETYHTLIAATRTLQRPTRQRLLLQLELVAYSTLSARYEGATVLDIAAQLQHDTGLDLVAQLAEHVAPDQLIMQALGAAQQRFDATPEHERGMSLVDALTTLAQLIIQTIGMAGRAFDAKLLRAMPSLAPLAGLSPALAVVQRNLESTLDFFAGRFESARRAYLEIAQRVAEPDGGGLEETHRFHVHAAALWAAGMTEATFGRPSALERADAIQHNPLFMTSALRIRELRALALGDCIGANQYRRQTELLQIQNCPPQLFEGAHAMYSTIAYAAIGDLLRVKQGLVDLEAMALEYPDWKPVLHCGRGAYQMLRGDYAQAQSEFERGLALVTMMEHVATYCAGSLVWALVRQEDFRGAAERGRALLAQLESDEARAWAHPLLVPLALAESRLGEFGIGLRYCELAIEALCADGGAGVALGRAYEVRAYIALHMSDADAFQKYSAACEAQYRLGTGNGLLTRVEKLRRSAHDAGLIVLPETQLPPAPLLDPEPDMQQAVISALGTAHDSATRSERALRLLGQATGSESGFLYLVQRTGPTLVAQLGSPSPGLELTELVARVVREMTEEQPTTQSVPTGDGSRPGPSAQDSRFAPIVLSHQARDGVLMTGVALMSIDSSRALRVPRRLVQALSSALFNAGDAVSQSLP